MLGLKTPRQKSMSASPIDWANIKVGIMQKQKVTFQQPRYLKAFKCFAWVYDMTFELGPDGGIAF